MKWQDIAAELLREAGLLLVRRVVPLLLAATLALLADARFLDGDLARELLRVLEQSVSLSSPDRLPSKR